MNWIEILLGFVGGGGLIALFSTPYKIRKERAEAEKAVSDNWKMYSEDIKTELNGIKKESKKQFTAIMAAVNCRVLSQHPSESCPVIDEFMNPKSEEE